jgi:hypothetical protein
LPKDAPEGWNVKLKHTIFALSGFFGLLFYLPDATIDAYIFQRGTFWNLLFFNVPRHDFCVRGVMVVGFLAFGLLASRILAGRRRAEEALHEAHERAIWLARISQENPNPVARAAALRLPTEGGNDEGGE